MARAVPKQVAESWERIRAEPPLGAVVASRSLHQALSQWQAALVREALGEGASWEDIGQALGTTRQAAWARFRHAIEGGTARMEEQQQRREQRKEVWKNGQARLRELDERWREDSARIRDELQEAKRRLNEAKQRHAEERRAAREELRRTMAALKAGISEQ